MVDLGLRKIARLVLFPIAGIVCCALLAACSGPSASVQGTIVWHSGKPFAGQEILLVPILPADQVEVIDMRKGFRGPVPLEEIGYGRKYPPVLGVMLPGATDYRGLLLWFAETDDAGSFLVENVAPGRYVLCWKTNERFPLVTEGGYLRIDVQEGQLEDLGTIVLRDHSEW